MLDNYASEFQLLKKLLRRPAFRFVIVRYNHFSLINRLREDIATYYPDRSIQTIDAEKADFHELMEAYYELDAGILLVHNFQDLITESRDSQGQETPAMAQENERRRGITAGLNLRRDKLAKFPNALIILISASDDEQYARKLMEKMPDLWSFRSLFLDLEMEREVERALIEKIPSESVMEPIVIEESEGIKAEQEIERLQNLLTETSEEEMALRLTYYPQLTEKLVEMGYYDRAVVYYDEWLEWASDNEKGKIYFDKGKALNNQGNLLEAKKAFEIALSIFQQEGAKNWMGLCYENLGDIAQKMGDLENAMSLYEKYKQIELQLIEDFPEESIYKGNLGVSYERLGDINSRLGNLEKALNYFEAYNQLEKELYESYPTDVRFKNSLAISYLKLGETYSSLGDLEKALQYFEDYNRLEKELYDTYPTNVNFKNGLAVSYSRLGETHSSLGDLKRALQYFEWDVQLTKEIYETYSTDVRFKNNLAISYLKLGETHSSLGNLKRALQYFEDYNRLEKELYDTYPTNVNFKNGLAVSYSRLGETHSSLGNLKRALQHFEDYNQLKKELYKSNPTNVRFKNGLAISYWRLGDFYRKQLEKLKAISYFHQCRKLLEELIQQSPNYKQIQENLAEVEEDIKQLEKEGL